MRSIFLFLLFFSLRGIPQQHIKNSLSWKVPYVIEIERLFCTTTLHFFLLCSDHKKNKKKTKSHPGVSVKLNSGTASLPAEMFSRIKLPHYRPRCANKKIFLANMSSAHYQIFLAMKSCNAAPFVCFVM